VVIRQTGSHMPLKSTLRGMPMTLLSLRHDPLKVGTLAGILSEVAGYLEIDRPKLDKELFE
jgi:predicted RNA binding protein YcfA (HicA-like mRNA interferase family)